MAQNNKTQNKFCHHLIPHHPLTMLMWEEEYSLPMDSLQVLLHEAELADGALPRPQTVHPRRDDPDTIPPLVGEHTIVEKLHLSPVG